MDTITISQTLWRGQAAWLCEGDTLDIIVTVLGGHLACLRLRGDDLNPLWQPPWPAGEPTSVDRLDTWGDGPEASLLAGIVGHNVCIDRFGGPWPGESRPVHGEAGTSTWACEPTAEGLLFTVYCEEAELQVERLIALHGHRVIVTTTVRQAGDQPQPIEWCEHASIGDPFLNGAEVTAGVDQAWTGPWSPEPAWRWSQSLLAVPPASALAMPSQSQAAPVGDIITCRVTEGWWRMHRPDLGRTLTYRWQAEDFPWLCLWTEHRSRHAAPWQGHTRARGMELSTKPFPEGKPPVDRAESFHGVTTKSSVPPGSAGLQKVFSIEWV